VINKKDISLIHLLIKDNLNYVGSIPEYSFYDNGEVSLSEYNDLCLEFQSKNWSVKKRQLNI